MVSERALGAHVCGAGLAGSGAQALDPLELLADPPKRALAVLAVAQLLVGVVADDQAPGGVAFAQARRLSLTWR